MPPVTFVVSLCKLYAVGLILRSKIADVHGIEVHDVRTWKFVYFQKIFRFLLHNTRDVTTGARGHSFSGAESLRGEKSHSSVISTFFRTVHLLPKDLRFKHGGAKLISPGAIYPRRYAPAHHDCLAKMTKFVCKNTCPSVANYQSQAI